MSDQHSSPIKTWQQLVVVVVAAFVVPVIVIAMLAALVTSGKKGENADPRAVVERIRPVGTVLMAAPGEQSTLAPAAGPAAAASPPVVATVIPPAAAPVPAATGKPEGKNVYETACAACHGAGVAGAPKFSDKVAWAPRLASGKDALYASALKGKGAMPPKGGQAQLPDDQVKAAVDYMVGALR